MRQFSRGSIGLFVAGGIAAILIAFGIWLVVEHRLFADAPRETLDRLHLARGISVSLLVFGLAAAVLLRRIRPLEQSESRYRAILEHSTNLFYTHTPDHRLTYVSPQARQFFGIEPEEAKRRWTEFLTDRPANKVGIERTRQAIETGEAQPPYELELVRADGRRIWVEVHEAPVVEDARTVAIIGALTNITARKRAEEERRQSQKLEAVGRLAGGIAHDFNNLLTVILGAAEMAHQESGEEAVRRALTDIRGAAERAGGLTRQLLAFSRRQVMFPEPLDLNRLLDELAPLLERVVGETIEMRIEHHPALWVVRADPAQIEQVVMNLVVNAHDAMPGGGVLTVSTDNVELRAEELEGRPYILPGEYVALTVRDTGIGMDEEIQGRLFEPFFTTKGPDRGSGLGLPTALGIAKQSGGYLEVESEPGEGSTFTLLLPHHEGIPAADESEVGEASLPSRPATVLVVEDEPALRELLRTTLERHGLNVLAAGDAAEAATAFEQADGAIDLLISDVILPGERGPELARRLRDDRPTLPVLFMSGYGGEEIGILEIEREANGFLQKPFTPQALLVEVARLLADRDGPA